MRTWRVTVRYNCMKVRGIYRDLYHKFVWNIDGYVDSTADVSLAEIRCQHGCAHLILWTRRLTDSKYSSISLEQDSIVRSDERFA